MIDRSTTRDTPMIQWPLYRSHSLFGTSLSRKPSWPAFMCERIDRPDIWTQRSDQNAANTLRGGGRPHMDTGLCRRTGEAHPAAPAHEQRLLEGG